MKISIICEKPGWILYRLAEELKNRLRSHTIFINEAVSNADINYYIDYSHFTGKSGAVDMGFFTHFEPNEQGEKWKTRVKELDYCIAQSEGSRRILIANGFPEDRISVIITGADPEFLPKVRIGILGRTYPSGRKGEHLAKELLIDSEIMKMVSIVSKHDGWGVPVNDLDYKDFYNSIDFLLIPSLVEGGPLPLIEALACGKLAIAPPIGHALQFDHIEYRTGDINDLKRVILEVCRPVYEQRHKLSLQIKRYDWNYWAMEHEKVFEMLYKRNSDRRRARTGSPANLAEHHEEMSLDACRAEVARLERHVRHLETSLDRIRETLVYRIYSKTLRPIKNLFRSGS